MCSPPPAWIWLAQAKSAANNTKTYFVNLTQDTKTVAEYAVEKTYEGAQAVHHGFQVAAQQPVSQNTSDIGSAVIGTFRTKNPFKAVSIIVDIPFDFLSGDMFDKQGPIAFDSRKDAPAIVTTTGMGDQDFDMRRFNNLVNDTLRADKSTLISNYTHINLPRIGKFNITVGMGDVFAQAVGDEVFGGTSINAIHAATALQKGIEQKGSVFSAGHSQGVAINRGAYGLLSLAEKSKVHALGIGSEWTLNEKTIGLASAYNARNSEDPVPFVGMMLGLAGNFLPWNWDRVMDMGQSWHVFNSPQNGTPEGSRGNKHDAILYYPPAVQDWADEMRRKGNLK